MPRYRWILPLLLILTGLRPASAGQDAWAPFGPGDGALRSLAASSRGDLYTTATFGATEIWQMPLGPVPGTAAWRWRNNGLGRPAVIALAVDPKNPQSLWAVSGTDFQSLFHSTNAGGSWTRVFTGDANFRIVHLWVVPKGRSVVLIAETGAGRRLLRSTNGGVSWTEVPRALAPVTAVPDEPGIVYAAATVRGGVVRSVDGGASFRVIGGVPVAAGDELRALHATYSDEAVIFASFRTGGLFRSISNGAHWTRVGFGSGGPSALASEPRDPSMIYAIDAIGLSASHQYGQDGSFQRLAVFPSISVPSRPCSSRLRVGRISSPAPTSTATPAASSRWWKRPVSKASASPSCASIQPTSRSSPCAPPQAASKTPATSVRTSRPTAA